MSKGRLQQQAEKGDMQGKSRRYGFVVFFIFVAGLFILGMGFHIDQYTEVLATSEEIFDPEERLKELRTRVEKEFSNVINPFSGKTTAQEDSPLNFTIELVEDVPTYFYYDEIGAKIKLRSYPGEASREDRKGEAPDV